MKVISVEQIEQEGWKIIKGIRAIKAQLKRGIGLTMDEYGRIWNERDTWIASAVRVEKQ